MCLSVGAQPGHTGVIFSDTTGGTPQRFLWAPTTDPDMPELTTDPPAPLDMVLPSWEPGEDGVVEVIYGPPEIAQTLISSHLARQRGKGNALDGHALLTRCKVAALLAIMHGRLTVSQWDWDQSAVVMAVSEQTRADLVECEEQARLDYVRREGERRAAMGEAQTDFVLTSVRESIVRFLGEGEQSGSVLKRRLGSNPGRRGCFDAAIAELTAEGVIEAVSVPGGYRYRLARFDDGDQGGHPQYSQVNAGDYAGHGDQAGNVISLHNSRSQKRDGPKLSCQKWFDQHIAELVAAGTTAVESFAVYKAGRAAGYSDGQLRVAKSSRADIEVIEARGRRGNTWSLTNAA